MIDKVTWLGLHWPLTSRL